VTTSTGRLRIALEGLGATVGPTDGAARYLDGLALGLSRQPQLDLLVLHGPSMRGVLQLPAHVRCQTLGRARRRDRVLAQHLSTPQLASRWGADAVIYTGNYCPLAPGPPRVVVLQNMLLIAGTSDFGYAAAAYRRWQLGRIAKHADRIVAISRYLADAVLERLPHVAAKLTVVTPGVDERFFERQDDLMNTPRWHPRPYFLCVGTAWRYRDYELAISALAASGLDQDLVVAGAAKADDRERLTRHARRLGLRGEVVMAGNVANNQIRGAYRDATALVATSRIESFALSVLEAMAVGTPVVAARRTVYPETVGGAGLLCAANAADIAEGLRAVTESSVRDELIARGREHAACARWRETASKMGSVARESSSRR
jgi:glycosyltransferase involved in cell wall biosynthesis